MPVAEKYDSRASNARLYRGKRLRAALPCLSGVVVKWLTNNFHPRFGSSEETPLLLPQHQERFLARGSHQPGNDTTVGKRCGPSEVKKCRRNSHIGCPLGTGRPGLMMLSYTRHASWAHRFVHPWTCLAHRCPASPLLGTELVACTPCTCKPIPNHHGQEVCCTERSPQQLPLLHL